MLKNDRRIQNKTMESPFNEDGTLRAGFGFKVFYQKKDGTLTTLHGDKFEVGETYTLDGEIEVCRRGYHYCRNLKHCYRFYLSLPEISTCTYINPLVMCVIRVLGEIKYQKEKYTTKYCTNSYYLIQKLHGTYAFGWMNDKEYMTFDNGILVRNDAFPVHPYDSEYHIYIEDGKICR